MKNLFILPIFILFLPLICKNDQIKFKKNQNVLEVNIIQEQFANPTDPVEFVKLFITSLGNRDFSKAYEMHSIKSWGTYEQFSSEKSFGGIYMVEIYTVKLLHQNSQKAKVFADVLYYDRVNGNKRFKQIYYLDKTPSSWTISKLEVANDNDPKQQINKVLSNTKFLPNDKAKYEKNNSHSLTKYSFNNYDIYLVKTINEEYISFRWYPNVIYSFFKFNKENIMTEKYIKFVELPNEPYSTEIYNINDNKDLIVFQLATGPFQGYMSYYLGLYYNDGFQITNVGEILEESQDNLNFEIKILSRKTNNMPDLKISLLRNSRIVNVDIYIYNGTKYVKNNKI